MVDLHTAGYPLVVFCWVTLALATPFVVARLYVQLRYRCKPWPELFVIAAWAMYLACVVDDSLLNDWDWFNDDVSFDGKTDAEVAPAYKTQFTWGIFYNEIMYACKAALLCFYMDLAPRLILPKEWWLIVVSWVFVIVAAINHFLYGLLQCGLPVSINWTWSKLQWDSGTCTSFQPPWFITASALHVFTDFLVYLIPFLILRHLRNLTPGEKRGAYAMFALGFFNILSAISSFVYNVGLMTVEWSGAWSEDTWFKFDQAFMFLLPFQAASAIIIICMPQTRSLWRVWRGRGEVVADELKLSQPSTTAATGDTGKSTLVGRKSLDAAAVPETEKGDNAV